MDLMQQISELKAHAMTYLYNNQKIQKIVGYKKKREVINANIEKVAEKIVDWRKF
jgi:hypothetical protein